MKEVAESAMREVVGQSNIQPILTQARQKTEEAVQKLMHGVLDSYGAGIQIDQVQLQKVDPPAQVIDAFRDVQAARADKERLQNEAYAYSNKVVPEARGEAERILQAAEGYKQQVVADATGQTSRFLKVYEEYKKAPEVTRRRMFLETMERVLGGTDKIIIDSKGSGRRAVSAARSAAESSELDHRGGQLIMRALLALLIIAVGLAAVAVYSSAFIVHQNEQALVLRFGEPKREVISSPACTGRCRSSTRSRFRQAHPRPR